jgi:DtxR family Mn-dependent transcriptional regulator
LVGNHEREISASLEHYVDAVYALRREHGYARVVDVARRLSVSKATVSAVMRALVERGLVKIGPNRFLELSPAGERLATSLESRNAILRRFLTDVLGVPRADAEADACRMEHGIGAATADRLVDLIRFFDAKDAKTRAVLRRFHAFRRDCATHAPCEPCEFGCAAGRLVQIGAAPAKGHPAGRPPKARRARARRKA